MTQLACGLIPEQDGFQVNHLFIFVYISSSVALYETFSLFSCFFFIDFEGWLSIASMYLGVPCLHGSSGMKNRGFRITVLVHVTNISCSFLVTHCFIDDTSDIHTRNHSHTLLPYYAFHQDCKPHLYLAGSLLLFPVSSSFKTYKHTTITTIHRTISA